MTSTRSITVLTWADYIDPRSLLEFEYEYAIRVELETVPSAAEIVKRIQSNTHGVDVFVTPDYAVRELESLRRLDYLDHSRLTNLRHLDGRFRKERAYDPGSRLSVVKDWGTTGFIFRTDLVTENPKSWGDFWKLATKYSGKVTVLDAPTPVIGAALKKRGHSFYSNDEAALRQARADLLELKPHLLAFETNYKSLLASGTACLSLGWNGDASTLRSQGLPIEYVLPTEGSQMWEDDWAVSRHAPDPGSAHLFINFMLRPDIAAQEVLYTRYATANRTALALLGDSVREDQAIYPPPEALARLDPPGSLDRLGFERRAALWQEIRRA